MALNDLRPPKGMKHRKKRIGRGHGSGTGKTAGAGHKGQKSRSGYHFKRGFSGVDMSHISPLATCDNRMSLALVKASQVLRAGWRRFRPRLGHA